MLKDCEWSNDRDYKTGSSNEPIQFYLDGLANSTQFDLLLGYFSSAAINLLSVGFATFISKGGKMRMVINHLLSEADRNAIQNAESIDSVNKIFDLTDVVSLGRIFDDYDRHFFECLAFLISEKRIEIKIIKPKNGKGIAHYKSGVFSDGVDKIGYKASCNFTLYGLSENLEELEAFLSWENGRSNKLIKKRLNLIDSYFSESDQDVNYLNSEDIEVAIKDKYGNKDIEELVVQEEELLKRKMILIKNPNVKKTILKLLEEIDFTRKQPRFPYSSGPRAYQIEAYENWVKNGYTGLFAMATGTGKTITSLNCVLEEYNKNLFYKFIVLVPTISLSHQWEDEIVNSFNFTEIISCSSVNEWESSLKNLGRALRYDIDSNFCILTTYSTFRSTKFQNIFNQYFSNYLQDITLIADEAHTFGSPALSKLMPKNILKRIGLSATPNRQFDEIGIASLSTYFNSYAPNYTFSYDMKEAINSDVLSRYFYYPKFVSLSEDEMIEYAKISKELMKYFDFENGKYHDSPFVNQKLIERKNILHKAKSKSECLVNIIDEIGPHNFTKAFIYVPEGYESNYAENDVEKFDISDERLIQSYTKLLYNRYKFKLRTFTGETKDRFEVLTQFKEGKLDALLAMKCLDEGVDIPQTKYAIFCSSTGNPRQYIQRRGRVLRKHVDKKYAYLFDMVVKPKLDPTSSDPLMLKIEKSIFKSELSRLINFAVLAENKIECLKLLSRTPKN
jgi:superfamily II DNA or RNA helicase